MLFQSNSSLLIFCNYYKLRPYFNRKPYRKKKRASYDPDGQPKNFHFVKYFDRVFFKKSILKLSKVPFIKKNLLANTTSLHFNIKSNKFAKRFKSYLKNWLKSLKIRKLGIVATKSSKSGMLIYKAVKKNSNLMAFLRSKKNYKKLNVLINRVKLNRYKFTKFIYNIRRKIFYALVNLSKKKKYTSYIKLGCSTHGIRALIDSKKHQKIRMLGTPNKFTSFGGY